jgi:hypothetical protein
VALRFNPPPGWPAPPEALGHETGWQPGPDWQPDPSWPEAPPGWQFWVPEDVPADQTSAEDVLSRASAGASNRPQEASAGAEYWSPSGAAPTAQDHPQGLGLAAPAPPSSRTNQMAIAAFVLGLLGFLVIPAILAIVLGAVAVSRIRRSLQGGKALAVWGIVLGTGWLLLLAVGAATGFSFTVGTVPQSNVPGGHGVPFFSLATGDCFDFPTSTPASGIAFVEETPCNQPHDSQVVATFQASGASNSYPVASLRVLAAHGCDARIKGSLDSAKVTDSMSGRFLYPLADSWIAGQRTISCVIYSPTPISSSVVMK